MKLVFKTPAKINLGLCVLGKREDGYHEVETLMQMVDLYDDIELEPLPAGIELICDHEGVPKDSSNLAVRAAELLRKTSGRDLGCRIKLTKRIPMGAGLGGGSGNAAGVLMGLNALWDLKLEREKLQKLAAELGSDVPFFLTCAGGIGRGRGERVEPVQTSKKFKVILIFPRFAIATSEVYGALKLNLTKDQNNISILQKKLSQSDIAGLGKGLQNDLELVVLERFPVIQTVKDALGALNPQGVLLSGSGSTVFGIFEGSEQADRAFVECRKGPWDCFLTEAVADLSEFLPDRILNYP